MLEPLGEVIDDALFLLFVFGDVSGGALMLLVLRRVADVDDGDLACTSNAHFQLDRLVGGNLKVESSSPTVGVVCGGVTIKLTLGFVTLVAFTTGVDTLTEGSSSFMVGGDGDRRCLDSRGDTNTCCCGFFFGGVDNSAIVFHPLVASYVVVTIDGGGVEEGDADRDRGACGIYVDGWMFNITFCATIDNTPPNASPNAVPTSLSLLT